MSDRGKVKVTSRKRKKTQASSTSPFVDYAKNLINDKEKADQQLPATDTDRFPNLYSELYFPSYNKKNLNVEKKLAIPSDLKLTINSHIERMGLEFNDRELGRVNRSWVQEFYCNFFRHTLDSIHIRGSQVPITEAALEDALRCKPKTSDTDAFEQAEVELHCMMFDYDALRTVIATPDAPWVMDSDNKKPKGMLFHIEAVVRLCHQSSYRARGRCNFEATGARAPMQPSPASSRAK
ncbi:hypothetical protein AHAS_Ahas13G0379200, partial [Arachis hypogaea]